MDKITLGTRGSPLALKQTEMVIAALRKVAPQIQYEYKVIRTSGDWKPEDGDVPLPEEEGGKAQFAKEIENALLVGAIDCGVHSAKDMPAVLPDGLSMVHYLPRADARDAFLGNGPVDITSLKQGAVVGTCSPRRAALLLHARRDLKIVPLRGNVHTRIRKLCAGQVDVTLLAMSGLYRLGLDQGAEHGTVSPIDVRDMIPACGQGAIGIETRADHTDLIAVLNQINCVRTALCLAAEREVVRVMNGSCHTPIGVYATWDGQHLNLDACIASPDGCAVAKEQFSGSVRTMAEAVHAAEILGRTLKDNAPAGAL